jgi:uncharacterized protein YprB with RNaseH-like and TPR domain
MDLLQRLAHARTIDRLAQVGHGGRVEHPVVPVPAAPTRVSSTPAFERREVSIPLVLAPAGPRGFGVRMHDRPSLLGGCLERLELPTGPRLAVDLVCLGAGQGTRAVFLDTETTGLGGAAVPFIVGLAWYESGPERMLVSQWTLARLGGEADLLADVLGTLRKLMPEPLVSFNGASFDLPLLRVRARRHGLCDRVLGAGSDRHVDHVDLLHPARRLHKGRSRDCRLATLEQDLLGLHRRGDIDSAEIPAVFWAWVNNQGDPVAQRKLRAVCEHNLVDLVSLPALANKLAGFIREPGDLDRARRSARHLCERRGEQGGERGAEAQARMLLARWVDPGLAHGARRDSDWRAAALELANLERRAGAHERAAVLWRAAWEADPGCPVAAEAWAKQLEHGDRDFAEALRVARGSRLHCQRRISRLERRVEAVVVAVGSEPESRDRVPVPHESQPSPTKQAPPRAASAQNKQAPPRAASAQNKQAPPRAASAQNQQAPPRAASAQNQQEPPRERSPAPALGRSRAPGSSLLSVVEDHGGAKLRYRLLR